jgi:hypothetical protein
MNKLLILTILVFTVILFNKKNINDNFKSINRFTPFYYGNINSSSDYANRNYYYPYNYPSFYKLGEINVEFGPNKKYD